MNKFIGVIKRNSAHLSFFLLFALVFLLGEASGAVLAAFAESAELEDFTLNMAYSVGHLSDSRAESVTRAVISVWATLLALWTGGFAPRIPGIVLSGGVIAFKGAATGYTIGMMLRVYNLKGFALAAASVLPQYIILLPLMFLTAATAANAFREVSVKSGLKGYMVFAVFVLITGLLGALADSLITSGLINFLF